MAGQPPPARHRACGCGRPPAGGRWRRHAAPAPSTVWPSPVRPGVPGPPPVPGRPGPASGPWGAGPRCPWPVPVPPRPPPWLPGPAEASELLAPWVRSLRWSSGTVRRPASVRHGRGRAVHPAGRAAMGTAGRRASRVPHTRCPCLPGGCDPARCGSAVPEWRTRGGLPRVRSASAPRLADGGAHSPACTFPCHRFTDPLTEARA